MKSVPISQKTQQVAHSFLLVFHMLFNFGMIRYTVMKIGTHNGCGQWPALPG